MKTKKLIVLDVDNTLLHTWHHGDLQLALAMARGEDPQFEHDFNAEDYKKQLLSSFSNSYEWQDCIVCPRPHLEAFIDYLFKQDGYTHSNWTALFNEMDIIPTCSGHHNLFYWTVIPANFSSNSNDRDTVFSTNTETGRENLCGL